MSFVTDNFGFKQEERFDCGAKAGDVFAGQRRFPQQMYWDYKVDLNKIEFSKMTFFFFVKMPQNVNPLVPNDVIFSWNCSIEKIFEMLLLHGPDFFLSLTVKFDRRT